jgi:hypothetical protein
VVGLSFPKSWRAFSMRQVSKCVRLGWTCVLMSRAPVRATFGCRAKRIILLTIDEVDEAERASERQACAGDGSDLGFRLGSQANHRSCRIRTPKTADNGLRKRARRLN